MNELYFNMAEIINDSIHLQNWPWLRNIVNTSWNTRLYQVRNQGLDLTVRLQTVIVTIKNERDSPITDIYLRVRKPKRNVPGMTLNCVWLLGSISGTWGSMQYSFIAIISIITLSCSSCLAPTMVGILVV